MDFENLGVLFSIYNATYESFWLAKSCVHASSKFISGFSHFHYLFAYLLFANIYSFIFSALAENLILQRYKMIPLCGNLSNKLIFISFATLIILMIYVYLPLIYSKETYIWGFLVITKFSSFRPVLKNDFTGRDVNENFHVKFF